MDIYYFWYWWRENSWNPSAFSVPCRRGLIWADLHCGCAFFCSGCLRRDSVDAMRSATSSLPTSHGAFTAWVSLPGLHRIPQHFDHSATPLPLPALHRTPSLSHLHGMRFHLLSIWSFWTGLYEDVFKWKLPTVSFDEDTLLSPIKFHDFSMNTPMNKLPWLIVVSIYIKMLLFPTVNRLKIPLGI